MHLSHSDILDEYQSLEKMENERIIEFQEFDIWEIFWFATDWAFEKSINFRPFEKNYWTVLFILCPQRIWRSFKHPKTSLILNHSRKSLSFDHLIRNLNFSIWKNSMSFDHFKKFLCFRRHSRVWETH